MTSKDGEPFTATSASVFEARNTKSPAQDESSDTSTATPPLRTSSPSILSRSNTLTNAFSRSSSPSGKLSLSLGRFGRSSTSSPLANPSEANDDIRALIVRAFSPTVAVYASKEADDLARQKGLSSGFEQLIRPYGERVTGKVVVRDSTGASRAWEDFGIRFINLRSLASDAQSPQNGAALDALEELLDQYLESADNLETGEGPGGVSPYYQLFLGRLLSSQRISQHEAFLHPVACVITISSATPSPIETLRNLYQQTAQGSHTLPQYVNPEYLRYYVLVHDEDRDDFSKSTALFDQMKRHFGLHCHLLRLRSTNPAATNEDSENIPSCEWLTALEDIEQMQLAARVSSSEQSTLQSIFSIDAANIRTFVRELVAQSIIPHMEQKIAFWNEQIASRRRGISGRFMTFSKRWAGISSGTKTSSSTTGLSGSGASGNYDNVQDYYRHDTPEALLRRMADFATMLRDYKLATSTYELLRSDYANDKAWKYLAGANEMCCATTLLNPMANSSAKNKIETFDQMLETASYSYLTRCSQPAFTLRSLLLGVELLKVRGAIASETAMKWAVRALQSNLVGSIGHVLISERVTSCLVGRVGVGFNSWGTRKRKAAMWSVMAADEWMKLGRAEVAATRMDEAQEIYRDLKTGSSIEGYDHMAEFMGQLQLAVRMKLGQARARALSGLSISSVVEDEIEESSGQLENLDTRPHRRSMLGMANHLSEAPLSPVRLNRPDPLSRDDDFE